MLIHQHPHAALLPRRVSEQVTSSEEMGEDRFRDGTMTGSERRRR